MDSLAVPTAGGEGGSDTFPSESADNKDVGAAIADTTSAVDDDEEDETSAAGRRTEEAMTGTETVSWV
jgi:hypothetical protein